VRRKKIVVVGDRINSPNTKSSNASIELNGKHLSELKAFFRREGVGKSGHALRLVTSTLNLVLGLLSGRARNYRNYAQEHSIYKN